MSYQKQKLMQNSLKGKVKIYKEQLMNWVEKLNINSNKCVSLETNMMTKEERQCPMKEQCLKYKMIIVI